MSVYKMRGYGIKGPFAVASALALMLICSLFLGLPGALGESSTAEGTDMTSCKNSIGIDLGTTYSCVAIYRNGKVEIISNELGERTTPSQVAYITQNDTIVGSGCDAIKVMSPGSVAYDAKRLIGRDFTAKDVADDAKRWPFGVEDRSGKLYVRMKPSKSGDSFLVAPEEISAQVLRKMKETAESFIGDKVCAAVITVPAYFNNAQRQLTIDAAKIAGMEVARIINEPTAAAIAYGLNNKTDEGKTTRILVYDLGGGTFDVSILEIQDGMFEVKATGGNTHLGGQDFDNNLVNHVLKEWAKSQGGGIKRKDLSPKSLASLYVEAEKAKRVLSTGYEADITIPNFHNGKDLVEKVSRATFEQVNNSLFQQSFDVLRDVMKTAKFNVSDIEEVVLVGGSTRIPKIEKLITDMFKKTPKKSINPDEAVAYGAAVQAAVLSGADDSGVGEVLLLDVTSLTFGIEVQGGMVAPIIPRNTPIPIVKSQTFTTVTDNQSSVVIRVFEGERPMAKDNFELGKFELTGIPPSPRGIPQIEVSFKINADGLLEVAALDKGTGNKRTTVVRNDSRRLTPEQMEAMIKESEANAQKDKEVKDHAMAKNEMEMHLYSLELLLKSAESKKLNPSSVKVVKDEMESLKTWFAGNADSSTAEAIRSKITQSQETSSVLAKELYSVNDDSSPFQMDQSPKDNTTIGEDLDDDLSGADI